MTFILFKQNLKFFFLSTKSSNKHFFQPQKYIKNSKLVFLEVENLNFQTC